MLSVVNGIWAEEKLTFLIDLVGKATGWVPALILYLLHEAPLEEQNFEMVMYMIENSGAREDSLDSVYMNYA